MEKPVVVTVTFEAPYWWTLAQATGELKRFEDNFARMGQASSFRWTGVEIRRP